MELTPPFLNQAQDDDRSLTRLKKYLLELCFDLTTLLFNNLCPLPLPSGTVQTLPLASQALCGNWATIQPHLLLSHSLLPPVSATLSYPPFPQILVCFAHVGPLPRMPCSHFHLLTSYSIPTSQLSGSLPSFSSWKWTTPSVPSQSICVWLSLTFSVLTYILDNLHLSSPHFIYFSNRSLKTQKENSQRHLEPTSMLPHASHPPAILLTFPAQHFLNSVLL